mgnify:CR=1 FL=1
MTFMPSLRDEERELWSGSGPPWFFENSRVPIWLSRFAPIRISAISLCGFVFSRGTLSETLRRHETIHWVQQRELLGVGFFVLYILSWLWQLIRLRDGSAAYRAIPFEVEAYTFDHEVGYLRRRKCFAWLRGSPKPTA